MDDSTGEQGESGGRVADSGGNFRPGSAVVNSISSVMVRSLDGSISEWNKAAERHYGWSKRQAIGNVSHYLLNTVFPYPLSQINQELMSKGSWEGFLIHTLSDGKRVKVKSRWELAAQGDESSPAVKVVEINSVLGAVSPETSNLLVPLSRGAKLRELLWSKKVWWMGPFVLMLVAYAVLLRFADEVPLVPLLE